MGFKTIAQYTEDKYGDMFVLPNDGDTALVVFLYSSVEEVLLADVHYINTATYKGYVHCCGAGCPACNMQPKPIRTQPKLFIPLYNVTKNKIEFWDRTPKFEPMLNDAVFSKFANPSEFIFEITRHGAAGDVNTRYEIQAKYQNTKSLAEILSANNMTLPEGYDRICKDMSAAEMKAALSTPATPEVTEAFDYNAVPRGAAQIPAPAADPVDVPEDVPMPETPPIELPEYSAPPAEIPTGNLEVCGEPLPDTSDATDSLADVKF